jgi:hypothetical protein
MNMVDNFDDNIGNFDMDNNISVASDSAERREASKREMTRLLVKSKKRLVDHAEADLKSKNAL